VTRALTPRQAHVVELMATGLSNGEIGLAMGISEDGVKKHATNIFAILGVNNRLDAARAAGWIVDATPPERHRHVLRCKCGLTLEGAS